MYSISHVFILFVHLSTSCGCRHSDNSTKYSVLTLSRHQGFVAGTVEVVGSNDDGKIADRSTELLRKRRKTAKRKAKNLKLWRKHRVKNQQKKPKPSHK